MVRDDDFLPESKAPLLLFEMSPVAKPRRLFRFSPFGVIETDWIRPSEYVERRFNGD